LDVKGGNSLTANLRVQPHFLEILSGCQIDEDKREYRHAQEDQ